ncbi:sigma factor-like helix-turn-helix DNA-binding protein [uncultured Fretibacterium sp.]|uniref:sigma factor-like helix-turn-helix DNA-binding protein n=1 Tax=uncultured Fretibacterium sp. TaxID=1678694 RepID=UPI00260D187A|nr:sigma factor-like helix-turn-helix DNA-binding protein [uncultured Fretibacterium sp.]
MNGWDDDKERLERRMRFNALYDLYHPLLTERQRDVYEMLFFSDLAPAEVAKSLGVTRQAIHILVHRTMDRLEAIERDLKFAGIVERLEGRIRELEESLRRYTDV